ncbi:MAG TPA: RuBisCO large subunit C-terminal-like domain-containing protein [Thermodesulfovibrionia bacterium]|nr:RuBisCO large subunit C-terminal-like domain-containing protein [Thermodesulfovibrionia bacterium]
MSDFLEITYHITCKRGESVETLACEIAYEQTVEVSDACIEEDFIRTEVVGQVRQIERVGDCLYRVVIGYHPDVTGYEVPQFLNMLYGNISIKDNIRIVDMRIPDKLMRIFPGPGYGIEGIRRLTGVYGRPLASTALKPMGADIKALVRMAEDFALGGGDIVKDDHGLANQRYCRFNERVQAVQEAVSRGNAQTGSCTLYFPNVIGPAHEIESQAAFAVHHGVRGVLMSPFIVGMDTVRHIAQKYNIVVMGHPAFSGTHFHDPAHGITPALLLGTLFRLIGCDISIYPNAGGRFSFSLEQCHELNHHLTRPLNCIKPAFPCPAGGMSLERIPEMAAQYGADVIYLIGGALLQDRARLRQNTEKFLNTIRTCFEETRKTPVESVSSCEITSSKDCNPMLRFLRFQPSFQWDGRKPEVYKHTEHMDFRSVKRHELIGKNREKTRFDLRYFEIAPGGYSSLEKHIHEHVIIGARGTGHLLCGNDSFILEVNDIAYVPPCETHQLRNESDEPFGFYCIVDHERDKPVVVLTKQQASF